MLENEQKIVKNLKANNNSKQNYIMNNKGKPVNAVKPGNPDKYSFHDRGNFPSYDEYLLAMKRVQHRHSTKNSVTRELLSPRERHRQKEARKPSMIDNAADTWSCMEQSRRIGIIASMVPDEIIYKHYDHSVRTYETALMFIDVSGFTDLCENYTKVGRGGPSRLTQVLNSYIGSMVQEILTHNGDVLKFSGDAFLSMWKKTPRLTMQDVVHTAIDCGLIIQKNYGMYQTDVGIVLKVKVAISAGKSQFSIIGGDETSQTSYVITGQPVWDVKMAEYMSTAGDVITSASAWRYVNEAEYCTQPCGDGNHTKVLGVGAIWKRVEKLHTSLNLNRESGISTSKRGDESFHELNFREFSLRPAVVAAMRSSWWPGLRSFMLPPVLRAVDNEEPMDFLTEVRRVIVVFLNIITKNVSETVLIGVVDNVYKYVSTVSSESGGLVNKVSMFDKDMMFLVVFGLRGLKHEDEAQKALQCAYQLKECLIHPEIVNVSIGVTSGTTYCGVVGHVLRREYTVIGPTVNKAARLMMNYTNRVTCDKETFLRSKLNQELFKLMEEKQLKGIAKPGPIYEFNRRGWIENKSSWRHPLLGRNYELRKYKTTLHSAMHQQHRSFTRYRDHKYCIAFIGPKLAGKTRLIEECVNTTPNFIHTEKIMMIESEKVPFGLIRLIVAKSFVGGRAKTKRENYENRVRCSINMMNTTPAQIFGINTIFNCQFPLPENYQCPEDILSDISVKKVIQEICKNNFTTLWVLAVKEAQFVDDESWCVLLMLLETKTIFVVMTITDGVKLTRMASNCLSSNMIVNIHVTGIDRWYHAALACQLLDVQAIPADLQKVIESASGGMPGWIQNFVISLVQRGALSVVTVPRSEAMKQGAVMPSPALLQRDDSEISHSEDNLAKQHSHQSIYNVMSTGPNSNQDTAFTDVESDSVQMAVLAETFSFDDMKVDMAMDVVILKTYDSLSPFEKMLLKCSSVLGDVFSRRMLIHLLQNDSTRKVAQAIAKLFTIRVLECEGGDFTRDTSLVLVHPAPAMPTAKPPYCACLGTRQPADCRDLPMYAFCGYMKFRHTAFRTTTYDLLTENQKGLIDESEELKQTREQIRALSTETKVVGDLEHQTPFIRETSPLFKINLAGETSSIDYEASEGTGISSAFVGEQDKLFNAYLEYSDLCIINLNIPQAIRLLFEVENFVRNEKIYSKNYLNWMKEFNLARIYSQRGVCMLESGDLNEARKQLFHAMTLYRDPFPTSKHCVRIKDMRESIRQFMSLSVAPNLYVGRNNGYFGYFYEDIANSLLRLFKLFSLCKEPENASLAAKWGLNYALRTNSNLRIMSLCYGNMISVYRQQQKFSMCLKLEKRAMELCHRKRGQLDVTEVQSVCYLYTCIFLFYVEYGKKMESLEFGLSVMNMMTSFIDLSTRHMLMLWMLKLLLSELRIHDMVAIMREFFYMTDHYDLSSETWYYYYAMVILLDTGYCVEPYGACERYYIKKGDAILTCQNPMAAWNFFVCMWLITIRIGAWERSILWEEKIKQIMAKKFEKDESSIMVIVRLVEGLLITLVNEMDNRNVKKVLVLEKILKSMFKDMSNACSHAPMYRPRYFMLFAYYHYIIDKKMSAYRYLNKTSELAKQYSNNAMIIWAEHTQNHWKGTLNPKFVNYWTEHIQPDNLLDYRDFDAEKLKVVPYTLPLPRDLQ